MNKKQFYAFKYTDGLGTTTGTPNTDPGRFNGRLSIAGSVHSFKSSKQRDKWVERTGSRAVPRSAFNSRKRP